MSLETCNKDVPEFSLCGQTLKGKVVEMYDADTCKIVLPLNNSFYKFTCRLNGIDTPEMKPKKEKPNRETEILWAKKARNELMRMVCPNGKTIDNLEAKKEDIVKDLEENRNLITIKCMEFDKYGRLLVEMFVDGTSDSLNKILVNKGMAVEYNGGTKIAPWIQLTK